MSTRRLYIFGGRATAREIADCAREDARVSAIRFVVEDSAAAAEDEIGEGRLADELEATGETPFFLISMRDQDVRRRCLSVAAAHGLTPLTLVHGSARVSPSASIGAGTYVAANACVSCAAELGRHCIVGFNAVIGHDARLDEHVIVAPGACLGGGVRVGARCFLGANSFVHQDRRIGADVIVDALTYVERDVGDERICSARRTSVLPRHRALERL